MFDGQQLGETIVAQVKGFLEREIAPLKAENAELRERLAALEARPAPEKGEKGDTGERGADGANGADGKDGRDGLDAAGIVEALKDSGELVLTLADGRLVRTGIRDGEKGADGKDGFGFDDMDVAVLDDDRTIELSFKRGDEEKAFTLKWPTVIFRGSYKHGETYDAGDCVNWGGHMWVAERETSAKPDEPGKGWRLAVKRGRDGKDAK
jgi:integrin beta 3